MFTRTESFREFIRYYPIVSIIVGVHVFLYFLTILPIFPNRLLFEKLAGVNLYIAAGEYWRLVTPIVLHSGFSHMLFNSFSLVLFGPALERIIGKKKFMILYFSSGIAANIATFLIKPLTFIHVGSSGAIFGLFGFYIAIILFKKHLLSKQNTQIILTISAISLIMTFVQDNINVTAHIFGLITGIVIGAVFLTTEKAGF
ncbi:rhomboid family intramembrane serine protease [Bacillus methanolicus]|uniref:Rhomboid protease YdcA n=1 Tax=Bacillus methanolicus (strain MGA3 / ATCC 53907) TaxID=796606 RepID=I3E3S6_BACMM|nr:rhomboid family intramembrane serine protease [Bacillus methanolicus]AIE58745.1 Putative rhomboid protease YdcA [Bacillus methanolicus MGA3]EIJ81147.1 serine peptidase [Bacillus methanolicus MGA3]UQD50846.1 rhomboid family intramembrane serine protease [Bacillus methanolicus]